MSTPTEILTRLKMKTRSGSSLLVLKKCILILVQIVRWTVFRTVAIGVGTTAVGFCSKERLGLTQDTTKKVGIYSQRTGWEEGVSG